MSVLQMLHLVNISTSFALLCLMSGCTVWKEEWERCDLRWLDGEGPRQALHFLDFVGKQREPMLFQGRSSVKNCLGVEYDRDLQMGDIVMCLGPHYCTNVSSMYLYSTPTSAKGNFGMEAKAGSFTVSTALWCSPTAVSTFPSALARRCGGGGTLVVGGDRNQMGIRAATD